jgi:hypothetical protein
MCLCLCVTTACHWGTEPCQQSRTAREIASLVVISQVAAYQQLVHNNCNCARPL